MNTKEAIEFCKYMIKGNVIKGRNGKYERIIELLQRGEKYETMWGNLEYDMCRIADYDHLENHVKTSTMAWLNTVHNLEQKYFSKPIKKTLTIEFESDNKATTESSINLLKAYLERVRYIPPKIKYTVKEADDE